jgi:Predicted endonuclease distantly related to archaeal Holliday junction resolvase
LDHLETGRLGESLAERYFRGKGWTILGRNVRVKFGELDLVALDEGELVIVEVRTRSIGKVLPAEETVGPRKTEGSRAVGENLCREMPMDRAMEDRPPGDKPGSRRFPGVDSPA